MVAVEIQKQMSLIFKEMQTNAVKIQKNKDDLEKAIHQEQVCEEGLKDLAKKIKDCKGQEVVFIDQFLSIQKNLDTVKGFRDQSVCHRCILQNALLTLEKTQQTLQSRYNELGVKLNDANDNVTSIRW
jgi:hypothetical protein